MSYIQVDSAFSNPNGHVNEKALDWICSTVRHATNYVIDDIKGTGSTFSGPDSVESSGNLVSDRVCSDSRDNNNSSSSCDSSSSESSSAPCDLLELYCGNGNHTVAIAGDDTKLHYVLRCTSCSLHNFTS